MPHTFFPEPYNVCKCKKENIPINWMVIIHKSSIPTSRGE